MRFGTLTFLAPIFVLIALLCPVSGLAADVPRETLERLVEVNVEKAEVDHLNSIGKLSGEEYKTRLKALDTERTTLWEPHHLTSQISREELLRATSAIDSMTKMKFSLLESRWQKERDGFREAEQHRQEQTKNAVEKDARHAAEFQRQRLLLQRQLDQGKIDRDTFTVKDREAQAGITDLRKKFEEAGGGWPKRFDDRLADLTALLAKNPDALRPKSQGQPAGEGKPDFERDVKLAAEALVKYDETRWNKHGPSGAVYSHELGRLRTQYEALNQLPQFEAAYTRLAEPGLQALRMKYDPQHYRPPTVQTPPPAPPTDYTLWYWIGGGGVLLLILWFGRDEEQAPAGKPNTSGIYGTADWAAYEETPTTHTDVSRGVTFGKSSHPGLNLDAIGAPITSQPESHTLIVAQSGAGKGTRVIIPTLLRYASSMLVIDPKGENAAVTARTRKNQLHHEIQIINPWGVLKDHYRQQGFQTATFNPLDILDRNDPNITSIARTIATTISPVTDPKSAFWEGSAAKLLTGIFLWLTHRDQLDEQKTLARVQEIVNFQKPEFQKLLTKMLASNAFNGDLRQQVGQMADRSAADTYGGIMLHLQERTNFIDTAIKTSTASSSLSMDKLADGTLTIYLVVPFKVMKTHSTWLRMVISSAMHALIARWDNPAGKARHRCMFLIDEFGSMGHMPDIASHVAQMRGYGMDFTLILQGLNQLNEHYEKSKDSILGNCRYKYFCDVNDLESAKYLSQTLGKKTVRTTSTSTSQGATQAGQTEGSSTTHGETGRDLLTPDEIQHLGKNTAILLNPDGRPHYLHPIDYRRLEQTYQNLKNSHPHLYWNPPLSYDANPFYNN